MNPFGVVRRHYRDAMRLDKQYGMRITWRLKLHNFVWALKQVLF